MFFGKSVILLCICLQYAFVDNGYGLEANSPWMPSSTENLESYRFESNETVYDTNLEKNTSAQVRKMDNALSVAIVSPSLTVKIFPFKYANLSSIARTDIDLYWTVNSTQANSFLSTEKDFEKWMSCIYESYPIGTKPTKRLESKSDFFFSASYNIIPVNEEVGFNSSIFQVIVTSINNEINVIFIYNSLSYPVKPTYPGASVEVIFNIALDDDLVHAAVLPNSMTQNFKENARANNTCYFLGSFVYFFSSTSVRTTSISETNSISKMNVFDLNISEVSTVISTSDVTQYPSIKQFLTSSQIATSIEVMKISKFVASIFKTISAATNLYENNSASPTVSQPKTTALLSTIVDPTTSKLNTVPTAIATVLRSSTNVDDNTKLNSTQLKMVSTYSAMSGTTSNVLSTYYTLTSSESLLLLQSYLADSLFFNFTTSQTFFPSLWSTSEMTPNTTVLSSPIAETEIIEESLFYVLSSVSNQTISSSLTPKDNSSITKTTLLMTQPSAIFPLHMTVISDLSPSLNTLAAKKIFNKTTSIESSKEVSSLYEFSNTAFLTTDANLKITADISSNLRSTTTLIDHTSSSPNLPTTPNTIQSSFSIILKTRQSFVSIVSSISTIVNNLSAVVRFSTVLPSSLKALTPTSPISISSISTSSISTSSISTSSISTSSILTSSISTSSISTSSISTSSISTSSISTSSISTSSISTSSISTSSISTSSISTSSISTSSISTSYISTSSISASLHPTEWTEWSGDSQCTRSQDGTYRILQRKCRNVQPENAINCVGSSIKRDSCQQQIKSEETKGNTAKLIGRLTLKQILINNKEISKPELEIILQEKGNTYNKIKNETEGILFTMYRNNNINVKQIIITNLSIGSLIIDYIIVLNVFADSPITYEDVNKAHNNTGVYFKDSNLSVSQPVFIETTDYNDCNDKDACHPDALCINILNEISYSCQCKHTFTGNGFNCEPVKENNKSSHLLLVVIVVACCAAVILIILLVTCWRLKRKRKQQPFKKKFNNTLQFDAIRKEIDQRTNKELINIGGKDVRKTSEHLYADINERTVHENRNIYMELSGASEQQGTSTEKEQKQKQNQYTTFTPLRNQQPPDILPSHVHQDIPAKDSNKSLQETSLPRNENENPKITQRKKQPEKPKRLFKETNKSIPVRYLEKTKPDDIYYDIDEKRNSEEKRDENLYMELESSIIETAH